MRVVSFLSSLAAATACSKDVSISTFQMGDEYGGDGLIHNTRVLSPKVAGDYPTLIFFHGFALDVEVYDAILCDSAETNIVILPQMAMHPTGECLDADAELIMPYLYDETQGILARMGTLMPGFSYSRVGLGGHSRGGGVLSYAWSHGLLKDGDFSSVTFIDPVIANPDKDVPNAIMLTKTKVRTLYFNDPQSICVTHGWPDAIGAKISATDIEVVDAPECKHMDVCSSWGAFLPMCHSMHTNECRGRAMDSLASAGYGGPTLSVTV